MTTVRDHMTVDPMICESTDTIREAARMMRDNDIGNVLVKIDGSFGLVTDRDIVVRAVADDLAPESATVGDIATVGLESVGPDDDADEAVRTMREAKIRRVPVIEDGQPIGILSIGDMAIDRDKESALAEISAAPPNN